MVAFGLAVVAAIPEGRVEVEELGLLMIQILHPQIHHTILTRPVITTQGRHIHLHPLLIQILLGQLQQHLQHQLIRAHRKFLR